MKIICMENGNDLRLFLTVGKKYEVNRNEWYNNGTYIHLANDRRHCLIVHKSRFIIGNDEIRRLKLERIAEC